MGKRGRRVASGVVIALIAGTIAVLAVRYLSFLGSLENIAADIRVAALSPPVSQSKDIVVVAIDEATLAQFPYRSPVDRGFLANLIRTVAAKGAKVIGVDVILDQPTEAAKDDELKRVIRETKTPLFLSYTSAANVVGEDQLAYLNAFVPPEHRAEANLLSDPFDGTVRWINPGGSSALHPPGFVHKALALYGKPVRASRAEIAWHPRPNAETPAFAQYPAAAAAMLPEVWFKGKIVLIGAVLSITDRHRTPLAIIDDGDQGMMPGVLIQAHGIAQYLEGRQAPRLAFGWTVAITLLFALLGFGLSQFKRGIAFSFGVGAVFVAAYWAFAFLGYTRGLPILPVIAPSIAFALSLWMTDTLIGRAERKQREFVQGAFSRYVSPAVVDQLVNDPSAMSISGIRREATFIFTDIAGFTTLSELLTSEKLADTLNQYLDGACAIVLRHGGTIDKFIGDAIMAIFNAPIEQPDHAMRAVRCAVELDAYAEAFRVARNAEDVPIGVTRIGVHTGVATIGNFGSASRMDFTALGDTVNTAARTEGVNKYFGTRICVTQETVTLCPDLNFRPIGDIVLKGKTQAVTLFSPALDDADRALYADYQVAFDLLRKEDPAAVQAMTLLEGRYPDDPIVRFHLDRIAKGLVSARVVMEDKCRHERAMGTIRTALPMLALAGTALAGAAQAQTAAQLPSSADISRARVPEPPPPAPTFDLRIEAPEKTAVPKAVDEIEFAVSAIAVDGATAFPKAQVDAFFAPLAGKRITLDELRTAAAKLEALYRGEGYFLSRVFVPPQAVKDGVLRVQVVEGYISDVFIETDDASVRARLTAALKPLAGKRPIRLSDIESRLLVINDMPGISGSSVLRPGAELGASELVLTARPAVNQYALELSNTGSKELGPWVLSGSASLANPFGRSGQLDIGAGVGGGKLDEVRSGSLRYAEPLGSRGAIVSLGGLVAKAKPGGSIAALDVESLVTSLAGRLRYPVLRTRANSLFLDVGLALNRTRTEAANTRIVLDRTTVGEATLLYQQSGWLNGSTNVSASLFHGFGLFNASDGGATLPSVAGFDPHFTRLAYALQRTQLLPGRFSLFGAIQGQYTRDTLLSGELITFGGANIGRGYDPALIAGDRGLGGLLELRYDLGWSPGKAIDGIQLYAFGDAARATTLANGATAKTTDRIASLGAGVRVGVMRRGRVDLQFADARHTVAGSTGRDPRVVVIASFGF